MPFKIYTYEDPYNLKNAFFWDEIKNSPHLFSSQVMVNSFRELCEDDFGSLMCPLENVVKVVYAEWYRNIERHIAQYVTVSNRIQELQKADPEKSQFYQAITHDLGAFVQALSLFCELGIDGANLDKNYANFEQGIFIDLLREIKNSEKFQGYFLMPTDCTEKQLTDHIGRVVRNEIVAEAKKMQSSNANEGRNYMLKKRITKLQSKEKELSSELPQHIVIHGVHQFSALELRFIELLDSLGIEVIFLFNYHPKFPNVYETWKTVYDAFDVEFEHAANGKDASYSDSYPSRALARCLGQIVNGERSQLDLEAIKGTEFLRFQNLTEYTNFAAKHFNEALERAGGNQSPLAVMSEKIYSADRQVHDLLRVYYPEQSGDRHFLFYPIGQFFISLYDMWDQDSGNLCLDWALVRECFISDALKSGNRRKLIPILDIVQPYLEDVACYLDVKERLDMYIENYDKVQGMRNRTGTLMRQIEFYSPDKISREQILLFTDAIQELNDIAKQLFVPEDGETISFQQHFNTIRKFMDEELLQVAKGVEKELIVNLIDKIGHIDNELLVTSVNDLRQGLYYYLKQQDSENPDWIVRNFVQIEGDILRSELQRKGDQIPTYHFGCVSDRAMLKDIDDLLPWPLTDEFVRKSYSPIERTFQVYYASLKEYSNFMLYALFYGLYFNKAEFRLSYVAQDSNGEDSPFYLLDLLGVTPRPYSEGGLENQVRSSRTVEYAAGQNSTSLQKEHRMNFFLCPHKFFYDYALNDDIIVGNELGLKRFYANMLVDYVWPEIARRPPRVKDAILESCLNRGEYAIKDFFPFWQNTNDFRDGKREAKTYLTKYCDGKYHAAHMDNRLRFSKGLLLAENRHPFPGFAEANKVDNKTDKIIYSMNKVASPRQKLKKDIESYMRSGERYVNVGPWCNNCNYKMVCLQPYRESLDFVDEEEEEQA